MHANRFLLLLFVATALLLAACGGGGSATGVAPPPPPPVAAVDVMAVGPLEKTAPVTVNGTAFAASGAQVLINGEPASLADLAVGQVVTVRGEARSGAATARQIEYTPNVSGRVDAIDIGGGVMTVLGQRVRLDAQTVLDAALDDDSAGERVAVSGHVDALGEIVATRVDLIANDGPSLVMGLPQSVDDAGYVFRVGALSVDYSEALTVEVPGGVPTLETNVLAIGALGDDGVLRAEHLEAIERDLSRVSGFEGTLAGLVTRAPDGLGFGLAGLDVRTGDATAWQGGGPDDLHPGASVVIAGIVDVGGFIRALTVYLSGVIPTPGSTVLDLDGFSGVRVDGPFLTVIEQGDEFLVDVQVDPGVADLLDVRRIGDTLRIGFRNGVSVNASSLRARVVMPDLERLELAGATYATVRGFSGPRLDVDIAGAVLLVIDDSEWQVLDAALTGACALVMDGSTVATRADVDVTAASAATLNLAPGARIDGRLLAASALLYYGSGVDVDVRHDLTSAVVRLGGSH